MFGCSNPDNRERFGRTRDSLSAVFMTSFLLARRPARGRKRGPRSAGNFPRPRARVYDNCLGERGHPPVVRYVDETTNSRNRLNVSFESSPVVGRASATRLSRFTTGSFRSSQGKQGRHQPCIPERHDLGRSARSASSFRPGARLLPGSLRGKPARRPPGRRRGYGRRRWWWRRHWRLGWIRRGGLRYTRTAWAQRSGDHAGARRSRLRRPAIIERSNEQSMVVMFQPQVGVAGAGGAGSAGGAGRGHAAARARRDCQNGADADPAGGCQGLAVEEPGRQSTAVFVHSSAMGAVLAQPPRRPASIRDVERRPGQARVARPGWRADSEVHSGKSRHLRARQPGHLRGRRGAGRS